MTKTKNRTVKAKANSRAIYRKQEQSDGAYLLKLVLYMIIGLQWLWLTLPSGASVPLPVGLMIGLGFAAHEHFRIDRKIEYVVLLMALLAGYIEHVGLFLRV